MKPEYRSLETINTYNKSAKAYQDKFMEMDLYNNTYDLFCNLIEKENHDIFEIATGPGNVTIYLQKKRSDFNISGIDLSPEMILLAKKNNPYAKFKVMDCKNIGSIDRLFDGIMCAFCIPYLSEKEVRNLIADSSNLLDIEGVFYLSTMEGDYNKSGFETTSFSRNNRVYIYYLQQEYLRECLYE